MQRITPFFFPKCSYNVLFLSLAITQVVFVRGLTVVWKQVPVYTDAIPSHCSLTSQFLTIIEDCAAFCLLYQQCSTFMFTKSTKRCDIYKCILDMGSSPVVPTEINMKKRFFGHDESPCPERLGYTHEPDLNLCYRIGTEDDSWAGHSDMCVKDGGHLLLIENLAVHNLIAGLYQSNYSYLVVVDVDGTDEAEEGVFLNHANQPMTYFNWNRGDPNDRNHGQNCLVLGGGFGYKLIDHWCRDYWRHHEGYACQIDIQ